MIIKVCTVLFIILAVPQIGSTQVAQFRMDSIPMLDGKIVFQVDFASDMRKKEMRDSVTFYLNDVLNPYRGVFQVSTDDYTVCRITDYLDISNSFLQAVGIYMTYDLSLQYRNGGCTMKIHDLTYIEKKYFEAQEESIRKLNIPQYSAEEIMLDKRYKLLLTKNASERIAKASVERINAIIKDLEALFSK